MSSIKKYFTALMNDERVSLFDSLVRSFLSIISIGYGAGVKCVDRAFVCGIRKTYSVDVPVISVGNISLGGTGKTPFTIFLADHYLSKGKRPGVVIRGYGRDESAMLKDELPDTGIYVGQDRVAGARRAVADGKDVLILDDGFQHRRLERDLDILLVDCHRLFGNGKIFPRGFLREPVDSCVRADIIVLTRVGDPFSAEAKDAESVLGNIVGDKPVIMADHVPVCLKDVTGAIYGLPYLEGKTVLALSGIADHSQFNDMLGSCGYRVVDSLDMGDHHEYSERDIADLVSRSGRSGAEAIVTTAKDMVKLKSLDISAIEDRIYVLEIRMDIVKRKEELIDRLDRVAHGDRA